MLYYIYSSVFGIYIEFVYLQDNDGYLLLLELQNLFSICFMMFWGLDVNNIVCINYNGWILLYGYLVQWE